MNLIQTLPAPDQRNTCRIECAHDYDRTFEVVALYEADGRRFSASAKACESIFREKLFPSVARAQLHHKAIDNLRKAIAEHLAAVNPIPND